MILIPILLPMSKDATSFYRGAGPLGRLSRSLTNVNFHAPSEWDWASLSGADMIFLQRPFTDSHRRVFEMAKDNDKKIWLDYDDLLFDVPSDNPTYFKYMNPKVSGDVKFMISNADVVTVSTKALAKIYGKLNKDVRVIPNALNPDLLIHRKPGERKRGILWRGSRTHQKDAFMLSPMILKVSNMEANASWMWHFIGDNLWFLTDRMPHHRTFVMEPMDVIDYHKHIDKLAPTAMMVPLHECDFNKSKSNIAWIEGTFAGAATLAPDWAEWQKPGVITYASREDFEVKLQGILNGEFDTKALVDMSWKYIMESLTLVQTNKLRLQVICDLLGCTPERLGAF